MEDLKEKIILFVSIISTITQACFMLLKIFGVIDWNWAIILIPTYIHLVIDIICYHVF